MARTIVGVLRGGASNEYDLSLKTGAAIIAALPQDGYETRDIFIDKNGLWHVRGVPATPARALSQIDVALNALHGGAGEDGTVQRMLERAGVPYAGARSPAASLSLNKVRAREIIEKAGIRMPQAAFFNLDDGMTTGAMARAVFAQFGPPYIVKPWNEGASHGIRMASNLLDLPDAIGDVLDAHGTALVEQFIRGHEATVGLIEHFRGEELYALPPAHVYAPEGELFLQPTHHRENKIAYQSPSTFSYDEKTALMEAARAVHRALGLQHFSRIDMIVTPRTIYTLEANALPGLYDGAAFPIMLESVGSSLGEFLEHAVSLARSSR